MSNYKTSQESVSKFLGNLKKQTQHQRAMGGLLWQDYVGKKIAQNSLVADVNKGYLLIHTNHTSFVQLIRLKEANILAKLKKNYPSLQIKQVIVKVIDGLVIKEDIHREDTPSPQDIFIGENKENTTQEEANFDLSYSQLREKMLKRARGEEP